ncbi:glycoside hydrolase family 3 N-terminal domain-containing protein [Mucilaginibacter sp. PAMB04168]|uniref:glycoside hydrolase family 3 N-terminal domain-containing protein n=1 Tax=Mucilaginibacter sp. PAMB04168 TaxID=3138567 RepID=UPI0031F6032F
MRKIVYLWLTLLIAVNVQAQNKPLYKNATAPVNRRVADLLNRMTLEEKVGQLSVLLGWEMYEKNGNQVTVSAVFKKALKEQYTGMLWATLRADPWTKKTLLNGLNPELAARATNAIQKYAIENTRLGIPVFIAEECPHGHMAIGTTVFPTAIGQSSTWNPALIQNMATVIAKEARLQGTHIGYGPILDLAREPRWSRLEETYGEDAVLNSAMGQAVVKGFQGNSLSSGINVIATLKHFTAYGVPEGGHNGSSVSIGNRELHQSFLPPFKAAVKAGALSVMTAYNSIDGVPCSANPVLLKDVLRTDWGFNGFVVSDLGSISGLETNHKVAASAEAAAALAINSGLDADLSGYGYGPALIKAAKAGSVATAVIDTAVARILKLKFEMGLFEKPYVDVALAKNGVKTAKNIQLARQVAHESIILLKNDRGTLPLKRTLKSIAVIGPNADNMYNQLGDYTAPQDEASVITVVQGLRAKLPTTTNISYVKGCSVRDTSFNEIAKAVEVARKSEIAIVVLGGSSARDFKTKYESTGAAQVTANTISDMESGEGFDRSTLDLMGKQLKLLQEIVKTGTPVVLVLIEGRPLDINWPAEHVPAIINAWYPGMQGGNAIADVLFGDYNPAGRLPVSVPKSVGQLPVYYNYKKPSPHNYIETDSKPLYPFGYGLSYAKFDYSNLLISKIQGASGSSISVKFNIKNVSNREGDEVVQLYLTDDVSSVVTANKQLKKFSRIHLKAYEDKSVEFLLNEEDLQILDMNMKWVVEPGSFSVMVGASSADVKLTGSFSIGDGKK